MNTCCQHYIMLIVVPVYKNFKILFPIYDTTPINRHTTSPFTIQITQFTHNAWKTDNAIKVRRAMEAEFGGMRPLARRR